MEYEITNIEFTHQGALGLIEMIKKVISDVEDHKLEDEGIDLTIGIDSHIDIRIVCHFDSTYSKIILPDISELEERSVMLTVELFNNFGSIVSYKVKGVRVRRTSSKGWLTLLPIDVSNEVEKYFTITKES